MEENETDLLLPDDKLDEYEKQIRYKNENQVYKEEIEEKYKPKKKLFFIVFFKCIKVKFYLFFFEKSFVKKISINNFTIFSIGYINEHHLILYKHKKFFKYFTYTTI